MSGAALNMSETAGELEARLAPLEQVADDRARQDADRAGGCALHEAKGEQRLDRAARARSPPRKA